MEFLTDHRFLNVENVKLIKTNDEIRWTFDTELNGTKDETVIFHGIVDVEINTMWGRNIKPSNVKTKALDITYTSWNFGRVNWAQLREEQYFFRIWCNGFNALRVISVNGKDWVEILKENGLNYKSQIQQKYEHNMEIVNSLIGNSTLVEGIIKSDYEEVYILNDASLVKNMDVRKEKVMVSTTTGFSNLAKPKAYLTTHKNHLIKLLPFQKGLDTVSIFVEKKLHDGFNYIFILPDQNIDGLKKELEQYVLDTCIKKESNYNGKSYGFDYFIPNA